MDKIKDFCNDLQKIMEKHDIDFMGVNVEGGNTTIKIDFTVYSGTRHEIISNNSHYLDVNDIRRFLSGN